MLLFFFTLNCIFRILQLSGLSQMCHSQITQKRLGKSTRNQMLWKNPPCRWAVW